MRHDAALGILAFSPDGAVLASGGEDKHIFLWDTQTWKARGPLEGHSGPVYGLAFSPDGTHLASVSSTPDSCLIRIWNVSTCRQVGALGDGKAGMFDVAYSPDGKTLACGGWDSQLHLFDVATASERLVIPNVTTRHLRTLSFSPDSRRIASGGSGPTRLWNAATGEEISTPVRLHEGMCPIFLPNGNELACWTYPAGLITLCDLPSGQVRASWRAHLHPQAIIGLAVSRDGRFLASVGNEGLARVWSTDDQREVATCIGHQGGCYGVAFTPDGTRLATGGQEDHSIRIWDLPEICRVARWGDGPPSGVQHREPPYLWLNGLDHRVELANTVGMIDLNGAFTVEMWVNFGKGVQYFAGDETWPDGDNDIKRASGWVLRILEDQRLGFTAGATIADRPGVKWAEKRGAEIVVDDGWHHLAVSKSREGIDVFLDGKPHLHMTTSNITFVNSPFNMFLGSTNLQHFRRVNCRFKAFRVSGKQLYSQPFTPPAEFTRSDDTLLLLDFSAGKGDTLPDLSGQAHHGTIRGGSWSASEPAPK
jgi:WD40 repeat protein